MSQNTRGQSSPPSYIDGISVKISEKYKPPKRITLALSYSQRLMLNKLIQEPFPTYDFTLEESIKNRVHEWRKIRESNSEERKQRLDNLSQERICKTERNEVNQLITDSDTINTDIINNKETDTSHTYYSTESGVLIPMTAGQSQLQTCPIFQTQKRFNFSEFESDTSSPFDNMELKTINDLEELAEVLKRDVTIPTQNSNTQNIKKENQMNGYYYNHSFPPKTYPSQSDMMPSQERGNSVRSVTEIMKSLEEEIASNHIIEKISSVTKSPKKGKVESEDLENPFVSLSVEMQEMARTISGMGFPLPRVARACQALDGNQKKIVEHLLAMSDLLDLGFPEKNVVTALLKCNNDRDKALDLLIT